jgi:hypothetical protein
MTDGESLYADLLTYYGAMALSRRRSGPEGQSGAERWARQPHAVERSPKAAIFLRQDGVEDDISQP